jgi:hypothetical protein
MARNGKRSMRASVVIAACYLASPTFANDWGHAPSAVNPYFDARVTRVQTTPKDYSAFFAALRHKESRGNYQAVNTLNFLGAYQFGEAALIDLGYVRRDRDIYDNNYGGGFTGKHGIRSAQEFLRNPQVQDIAAEEWMQVMWRYIEAEGLHRYAWREVGGQTLSPSGMLAATHLLGSGALKNFVETGGRADIRDPYGMPLHVYIRDLGGFEIPFAPRQPRSSSS